VSNISRLKDLSKDKMTVIERILSSQGICKALKYEQANFLDQPDIDDPSELIMSKIYPYYRIPDAIETASTFILISFRNYGLVKNKFKSGIINIYAITHKDLIMTDHGFLRYDYIASEIEDLMNDQRGIGIGKPQFLKMDEVFINDDYMGNFVSYKLYEWN
jgi:hypothetical protein